MVDHLYHAGFERPVICFAEPPVSTATYIEIDPVKNRLTLFIDGSPYKTYPIALGKRETPSPSAN
ncbi:L,D-transpeptidase [Paenibacillus sp. P25]|nr:L,D-transpeptidase [Paenibacillus sp. P25]